MNNPGVEPKALLRDIKRHKQFRYVVFQSERGSSGTLHYQGYIEFKQPVAWTSARVLLYGAHIEKRRGTAKQAVAYCKKSEGRVDGPWELGSVSRQGQSGPDFGEALDLLVESRDIRKVVEEYPMVFVKNYRGMERLLEVTVKPRPLGIAPKCILLYGPTGTGKSHWAHTKFPDAFWKSPLCKWFDGYLDQTTVIMDEFAGRMSKYGLSSLLRLMDKYPLKVEIKGSCRDFLATTIVFTTNIHPYMWYEWAGRKSQWPALQRRFDEVWWFREKYDGVAHSALFLDKKSFFENWFETGTEEYQSITRPNTPLDSTEEEEEEEEEIAMIDLVSSDDEFELEQLAAQSMANLCDVFLGSSEDDPS